MLPVRYKIEYLSGSNIEKIVCDKRHLFVNSVYYRAILKNSLEKRTYELSVSYDKGLSYKTSNLIELAEFLDVLSIKLFTQNTKDRVTNFLK